MNLFEDGDQSASRREELLTKWKDKTPEEVLNAKVEADLFIDTLTKRQDDLSKDYLEARKQLEAQASLQELVDKLNGMQTPPSSETPNANDKREPQFDPKQIEDLISNKIQQNKLEEKRSANSAIVQAKLKERFGTNTASVLKEQATSLGLSEARVNELAQESPEAFFRLMGLNDTPRESFQAPPRSGQRNDNFSPKQVKRDWNYYQELKKTNPRLYLDPKIAVQMHNDAVALGADFGMPTD